MAQELLVEQIDAGRVCANEFHKTYPVTVYFWLKQTELERWYLYIAADGVEDIKIGYREILRIVGQTNQWLDPFQIKLVSSNDPVALAAASIRDRYPARVMDTHYNGSWLGEVEIDGAFIYAPLASISATA